MWLTIEFTGWPQFWMMGEDFKDACKNFALIDPAFKRYFDPERMIYWGCKLFDNEKDARKSFG